MEPSSMAPFSSERSEPLTASCDQRVKEDRLLLAPAANVTFPRRVKPRRGGRSGSIWPTPPRIPCRDLITPSAPWHPSVEAPTAVATDSRTRWHLPVEVWRWYRRRSRPRAAQMRTRMRRPPRRAAQTIWGLSSGRTRLHPYRSAQQPSSTRVKRGTPTRAGRSAGQRDRTPTICGIRSRGPKMARGVTLWFHFAFALSSGSPPPTTSSTASRAALGATTATSSLKTWSMTCSVADTPLCSHGAQGSRGQRTVVVAYMAGHWTATSRRQGPE